MNRKASGLVAFSLLALASTADADVRNVGPFTAIDLQGVMEVEVDIGRAISVDVKGAPDLARLVTTTVKNGTLVISTPDDFMKKLKGRKDTDLEVVITMPALSRVTISGTGEIEIDGLDGKPLDASIMGTGALDLEGKTDLLRLTVAGTGQVKAKDLVASAVELSVSGTAQAVVNATRSFEANVQGTAAVKVHGKPPTVKKNIVGTAVIDVK